MQVVYPQAAINNSYFSLPAGTSSSSHYLFNEDPSSSSPSSTMQPNLNDSVQIQQLLALLNNNMLPKQTAVVECPKSMVGRVIGKGGETIKALQQYTGAMIQIDQSTDPTRVTIAGSPQALQLAVSMVSDIVRGTFKGFAMLRQIAVQHGNGPSSSSNNNNNNSVAMAPLPPTFTPTMQQQQQRMPVMRPPPQTMQQQMYQQQPTPILVPPPPVVHAAPPPLTPAGPSPTAGTSHPVYIQGYGFIPPPQSTLGGEGGGGLDDVAAAMLQQQPQQQQQQQRHAPPPPMNPFRAAPPHGNNNSSSSNGGGDGISAQSLAALLGTLGAQSQNNDHNHVQQQQPGSDMNEALLTALLSQLTVGQQLHPQRQAQAATYQQQYAPHQQQYQHQQQDAPMLFHGGNEHTYGFPPPSSFLSSSPPSHPASSASPPCNSGHASPSMFPSVAHPHSHQQMGLSSSGDLPLLSSPTRQPTTAAGGGGGGSRYGAIGSARSPTGGSSLKGEHQDTSIANNSNVKVLAEPQQINVVTTAANEVTDEEEDGNTTGQKELLVPTTWADAVCNGSTTAAASPQGLATSPSSSN